MFNCQYRDVTQSCVSSPFDSINSIRTISGNTLNLKASSLLSEEI